MGPVHQRGVAEVELINVLRVHGLENGGRHRGRLSIQAVLVPPRQVGPCRSTS